MIINEMNINTLDEKYYKVQTQNWAHTSFSVMNAFSMRLAAEVVLNSFKTMILINIVDHPTKLVNIFALVPCVVCNNMQMLVLWLRWYGLDVFLVIKVSAERRGYKLR